MAPSAGAARRDGAGVGAHFGLGAPLQHVQELSAEAFQLREADPGGGGNERQPGLAGDRGRHGVRVSWGQAHTRPLEEEDPAARVTELGQGSLARQSQARERVPGRAGPPCPLS